MNARPPDDPPTIFEPGTERLPLFVGCPPGLERWLVDELRALGLQTLQAVEGGVEGSMPARDVPRLLVGCALGGTVALRVGEFSARHFGELVRKTAALPWPSLLPPGVPVEVRATSKRSRLYHTGGIAQRVRTGIEQSLGRPPEGSGTPLVVAVRLVRDQCTVSLDIAGEPLHRRGWRQQTAKAPLREDLARAVLVASGWNRTTPVLDPMMGSGTLLIEAATMAAGLAPGHARAFAWERITLADAASMSRARSEGRPEPPARMPALVGRDLRRGALEATRGNAARAGVEAWLDLDLADLRTTALPQGLEPGLVVVNPPYGERVGEGRDLPDLYRRLGERVAALGEDWAVAMVVLDRRMAKLTGLRLQPAATVDHGGSKVDIMVRRGRTTTR